MSTKARYKTLCRPKRTIKCTRVRNAGLRANPVVNLLNDINAQLTGANTNINNSLNRLSNVINNGSSSLNSNMTNSLSSLNANLADSITTTTNTIISNMNNAAAQSNCQVRFFFLSEGFRVPCGTSTTFIQNFASIPTEKVSLTAASNQAQASPCQAVLVIVTMDGTAIERPLPPVDPIVGNVEINITLDNYSTVSIRCDSLVQPPPENTFCTGLIQLTEIRCVCC